MNLHQRFSEKDLEQQKDLDAVLNEIERINEHSPAANLMIN